MNFKGIKMNLLEKYKAMAHAERKPTLSLVLNNQAATEKNSPTVIISNAIISINDGLKKNTEPAVAVNVPVVNSKASWSPEAQSLINWFIELEAPTEQFYLEPHRRVIDPQKCFASIRQEIATGPNCPRNKTGALLCDLNILKKILH